MAEINKFIRRCLDALSEAGINSSNDMKFLKDLAVKFISQLIPLLPVFKDESFEDEEEVRLVHMEGPILIDQESGKPYFVNDKYREFVSITPKYDVPFVNSTHEKKPVISPDEFSVSDISEIIIGPACEFSEARVAVRKLLLDNEFDVNNIEIRQANFSYCP